MTAHKPSPSSTSAARHIRQKAAPRPRGRPPKSEQSAGGGPEISKEAIHLRAIEMARTEPLSELSIASLAKHFGVTTALIHYYIGSRDALISGVVNQYFRVRVDKLKPLTGDWRTDAEQHARVTFDSMLEYGGVLRYLMSHNRFRLFQQVKEGETDYGLVYLNRVAHIFEAGGFTASQAAMGYHLLAQYVMAAAYAEVNRQLPGEHTDFIKSRILETPSDQFPAAHFFVDSFANIQSESAFNEGLRILLDGMERWKPSSPPPAGRTRKPRTPSR